MLGTIQRYPTNLDPKFHLVKVHEHVRGMGQVKLTAQNLETLDKTPIIGMKLTRSSRNHEKKKTLEVDQGKRNIKIPKEFK